MHIRTLSGKNICILGFGKEGQAMLKELEKLTPTPQIVIADKNQELGIMKYETQVGDRWLRNFERFNVIIKSPGIPPYELHNSQFIIHNSKLTSSTQIFLDTIANTGATVIGVTGSKGKSTTSTLIYEILKAAGKDVHLIGNIGKPAIGFIENAKSNTFFVQEMSSYQLMDLTVSPHIAVLTSFFPEHLDYHGSLENYLEAKKNIARFQGTDDMVFFPAEGDRYVFSSFDELRMTQKNVPVPFTVEIAKEGYGRKIPFLIDDAPLPLEQTHLIGRHNLSNIAAATRVAEELGVPGKVIVEAIKGFHGLPHRLQSLGVHHGTEWIDDAISTTPESTIAALEALGPRVATIILGGQDRGNDFSELGNAIAGSSIKHVILFPGSGPRIREAVEAAKASIEFHDVASMDEAVTIAKRVILSPSKGDTPIVLLSTASPSYNMFRNFEEKGEMFQKCIAGVSW